MPRPPKSKPEPAHAGAAPSLQTAAGLAWAGQHEQAVATSSVAIEAAGADLAARIDGLDVRAESLLALGRFDAALADAMAMGAAAKAVGTCSSRHSCR